jgi:hypothetical protein
MDPNVCLQNFVDAYENGQLEDAAEHYKNLAAWLSKGGFEPDWNLDPNRLYTLQVLKLGRAKK